MLYMTAVEHHDFIRQGHGFYLVVGDVNHGRAETVVQAGDLVTHLHPQRGIQVGERLVKQQNARLPRHGTAHRHPLALAAREGFGLTV